MHCAPKHTRVCFACTRACISVYGFLWFAAEWRKKFVAACSAGDEQQRRLYELTQALLQAQETIRTQQVSAQAHSSTLPRAKGTPRVHQADTRSTATHMHSRARTQRRALTRTLWSPQGVIDAENAKKEAHEEIARRLAEANAKAYADDDLSEERFLLNIAKTPHGR